MVISSNEISFIIQGLVQSHINQQIAGIRKYFPKSEIIVSSCNAIEYEVIGADKVLTSSDPGFFYYSKEQGAKVNNVNRQIISTLSGIKQATRKYVFKLRSDFFLKGDGFLKYWTEQPLKKDEFSIFEHKVVACCYCTRNPRNKLFPYPFHPSDIAFFGLKDDLLKLFDIPLMMEQEAYWEEKRNYFNQYVPEQHIFYNCLKKCGKSVDFHFYRDASQKNITQTENYFFSNFIFISYEKFNLLPTKKGFFCKNEAENFMTCYTTLEAQKAYMEIIENKNFVCFWDWERIKISYCLALLMLCRGIARGMFLLVPSRKIRKKFRPIMAQNLYKFLTFLI